MTRAVLNNYKAIDISPHGRLSSELGCFSILRLFKLRMMIHFGVKFATLGLVKFYWYGQDW